MNYWTQSKDNIYVAAHRGASADYPENTMLAFKKAIEMGVDQIETDIRITRDGELVIIHDALVDRTTDGTGFVNQKTLGEIKELDAGIKMGEQFKGERIPTFIEFMEYVKDIDGLTLDLELKEYPEEEGNEETAYSVCDRVLKIVDEYGFTDRVVINTFSGQLQEYIYEKYGKKYRQHVYYPINYMGRKFNYPPREYAYCACMFRTLYSEMNMASKEEFEKVRSLGVRTWAGATVNDEERTKIAIDCGAELITTNNPDIVLAALRKYGKHK